MKRIYLAGPGVFYPDPLAEGHRLKELCSALGLEGVYPMDAGLDLSQYSKQAGARAIYEANIRLIRSCDGIIADMQPFRGPGMDGGTAFEMGFAKALGLPVVGYGSTDMYLERTRQFYGRLQRVDAHDVDNAGLTVEDFDLPDNLMMACAPEVVVATEEEALVWLKRHFE